jgi:hypothetical protein
MATWPVAIEFDEGLRRVPLRDLDHQDPLGGVSGYQARKPPQCATPFCKTPPFFMS